MKEVARHVEGRAAADLRLRAAEEGVEAHRQGSEPVRADEHVPGDGGRDGHRAAELVSPALVPATTVYPLPATATPFADWFVPAPMGLVTVSELLRSPPVALNQSTNASCASAVGATLVGVAGGS